jgi:hypothetical protein
VLGRGALAIGAGIVTFAGWVMAAVGWLWMALLVCSAFARRIARIAWWLLARAFQVITYMAGLVAVRWRGGTATRASASA